MPRGGGPSASILRRKAVCAARFSWVVSRTRLPGRRLLEYVVLLPISVPGLAFGVGVMLVWIDVPFAAHRIVIHDS